MSNEDSNDGTVSLGPVKLPEALLELGYRGRGRPKLPEEQRRRQKLIVALSDDEMRVVMHRAADCTDGPKRLQDWARRVMLDDESFREQVRGITDRMQGGVDTDDLISGLEAIRKLLSES